jgi:hypothetical protein
VSGETTASAYLELLQRNYLLATGRGLETDAAYGTSILHELADEFHATDPLPDASSKLRDVLTEKWEAAAAERPSRFEDISTYIILSDLAKRIEETATEGGIQLPLRPIFGTLALGQFNAMAIRVPGTSDHIIAFQAGVFGFINLLSKAVAASFPLEEGDDAIRFSTDPEDVDDLLDRNPEPVSRFQQFVDAYVLDGDPHEAEQYLLTGAPTELASLLLDSAELFVMGHEYAHIINGHLAEDALLHHAPLGTDVEVVPRALEQEFEADTLGLELSIATMMRTRQVDVSLSFFGVYLIFSAMEVVDRAVSMLRPDIKPSSSADETHPAPDVRRAYLALWLAKMTNEETAVGALQLGEQIQRTLDALWQRVEPHYQDLRRRGAVPSPIWLG